MASTSVLVIDDEPSVLGVLKATLTRAGFDVVGLPDGASSIEAARKTTFHAAIVDLNMPGLSGLETVRLLREVDPDMEFIVLTGDVTLESALSACHEHVFDFLCKPVNFDLLIMTVKNAAERRNLLIQNRELIKQLEKERDGLKREVVEAQKVLGHHFTTAARLVGESPAIAQVRRAIVEVANSDMTVLVRGESGTGKNIVAQAIHELSDRNKKGQLVKINCPTIPETLIESELFGHETGAFTGADRRKPGRLELSGKGTIFLDEIGDLPLSMQAKLLQVIEQKQFQRVGGRETISIDARIIAATNAPLEEMIVAGRFRTDLFYRLNQLSIVIPPLRERPMDIPALIHHFIKKECERNGIEERVLSEEMMSRLIQYEWPGNVRELKAVIDRFCLTGREDSILEVFGQKAAKTVDNRIQSKLHDTEVRLIVSALTKARWNQRKAAMDLGISYSALRRRIEKHRLKELVD